MKRILTTTALAMMLSAPAFADAKSDKFMTSVSELEVLGSEFIGMRVYVVEKDLDQDYKHQSDAEKEWDDIGEINEIVMTRDGELKAVVIGVGGFVGIGENDVAVKMDKLRFVQDGDDVDDYFVVFTSTKSELENAPEWEDQEDRMEAAEEARDDADKVASRGKANLDDVKRDGYMMVEANSIKADTLIGARVYGTGNEDVGEISDLVLVKGSSDKQAIIDVGGLLGIGEKPVAVPMSDLRIMREKDGNDLAVYIDASQERLEALPEFEK